MNNVCLLLCSPMLVFPKLERGCHGSLIFISLLDILISFRELNNTQFVVFKFVFCFFLDLNECSDPSLNNCHLAAQCENTRGSFECTCSKGWTGNGVKCTNVDECSMGLHGCHQRAECKDTEGSYRCECLTGYEGDGFFCIGK